MVANSSNDYAIDDVCDAIRYEGKGWDVWMYGCMGVWMDGWMDGFMTFDF